MEFTIKEKKHTIGKKTRVDILTHVNGTIVLYGEDIDNIIANWLSGSYGASWASLVESEYVKNHNRNKGRTFEAGIRLGDTFIVHVRGEKKEYKLTRGSLLRGIRKLVEDNYNDCEEPWFLGELGNKDYHLQVDYMDDGDFDYIIQCAVLGEYTFD